MRSGSNKVNRRLLHCFPLLFLNYVNWRASNKLNQNRKGVIEYQKDLPGVVVVALIIESTFMKLSIIDIVRDTLVAVGVILHNRAMVTLVNSLK